MTDSKFPKLIMAALGIRVREFGDNLIVEVDWQPLETLPAGQHVLLWEPNPIPELPNVWIGYSSAIKRAASTRARMWAFMPAGPTNEGLDR